MCRMSHWLVVSIGVFAAALAASAVADGARIESADGERSAQAGDGGDLVIESMSNGSASTAEGDGAVRAGGKVSVRVAAAPQPEDERLPTPEERDLPLGERLTIFKETYEVDYIDDMRLDEAGNQQPVIETVAFGRWVDVSVNEASDGEVDISLYVVRKRPINFPPDAKQPLLKLPEADYNMVSRQVRLTRGGSERLRIRDGDGEPIGVRLSLPGS